MRDTKGSRHSLLDCSLTLYSQALLCSARHISCAVAIYTFPVRTCPGDVVWLFWMERIAYTKSPLVLANPSKLAHPRPVSFSFC